MPLNHFLPGGVPPNTVVLTVAYAQSSCTHGTQPWRSLCPPQCPSTDCPKGWSPRGLASRIGCSLMDQKGRYGSQREVHTHDCRLGQWMRPHTCQRRCTGRPQAKGDTLCPTSKSFPSRGPVEGPRILCRDWGQMLRRSIEKILFAYRHDCHLARRSKNPVLLS